LLRAPVEVESLLVLLRDVSLLVLVGFVSLVVLVEAELRPKLVGDVSLLILE